MRRRVDDHWAAGGKHAQRLPRDERIKDQREVLGSCDFALRVFAAGAGSNKRVAAAYDVRLRRANTRRVMPL